jgi:hypothetical protein
VFDKTSDKGGIIMNTDQIRLQPMNEDQLEDVKKEIVQTFLFLVSRTGYDLQVVEVMKLSALADVQRRFFPVSPKTLCQRCSPLLSQSSNIMLPKFHTFMVFTFQIPLITIPIRNLTS